MAYDKLGIINSCLIRTGNNPVTAEGDGTPEWLVAGDAYDTELPLVIAAHNWGFATSVATLERIGASPDDRWLYQYRKPAGCLHLISVLTSQDYPMDFDLLDNTVLTDGTVCRGKYVRQPTPESWPDLFLEALRMRVMSHIYRGLNEDPVEAARMGVAAEAKISEARSRLDQEKPIRARVNSGLLRGRMVRKTQRYDRGGL